MTFDELIDICRPLDIHGRRPDQFGGLTQDSRQVSEGSVFIAVRGLQVDGHMFIENAVSKGASVVICEDVYYTEEDDVCVVEVENTRNLVGPLAQAFEGYPARTLVLIGITGTNGKTTVATLVYQALRTLGARPSLLGTVGKRINDQALESLLTTSDAIELARDMRRMVEADSSHLVMEVSSHALDQRRVAGLEFDVAGFTNLSHDHLDYHATLDDYAEAKKRLFDSLDEDATAIVNGDDPHASYMLKDCRAQKVRFGFRNKLDVDCRIVSSSSEGMRIEIDGTEIASPLIGNFNAGNVALAFLACRALGYDDEAIAGALQNAAGAAGRLERVQAGSDVSGEPLVLVDYAHTPDALENVLSTLKDLKTEEQQLHLVFGCGGNRDRAKRPKMASVAETYADRITVTSDNPRDEDPDAIVDEIMNGFTEDTRAAVTRITDRREAIEQAIRDADPGTILLIAGKGHETYQEIAGERHPFDDREIARNALKGSGNGTDRNGNGHSGPENGEVA